MPQGTSVPHLAVTGGAGFIGSAVLWALQQQGADRVTVVDDLGGGDFRNLAGLRFADYFNKHEFLRRLDTGAPLPRFDAVIHLGACSDTTEADAEFLMRNNFAYSRALAEWALNRGIRFIYASSAATYGGGEHGYVADPELLPRLRPLNAYAFSKHAFDLWARQSGALASITGLKYFNVYGPNEYHKGDMRSVALKAFEQISATGSATLFKSHRADVADGEQRRDFIYVKDAAAMTLWFLDHPEAAGIYNIGSGVAASFNELVRGVFSALGRKPQIHYKDMPESIRDRYQYFTRADIGGLRAAGCRLTARPVSEGVRDYVDGYLQSGNRYLGVEPAPRASRDGAA